MFKTQLEFLLVFLLSGATFGSPYSLTKRGIFGYDSFDGSEGLGQNAFLSQHQVYVHKVYTPSPGEIASAIQAAKEASANVMTAQHRVQEAKNEVLNQQHLATHKQAQAALALQKAEAASAVQQQEAKSAAQGLVQAQQRLAHAKSEVSELQRIASAKESHAAAIIQKSAAAAAAEIQRSDDTAKKISALQHSNTASIKQANAGKDGSLSATSAALAASAHSEGQLTAWVAGPKLLQLQPWG